MVNKETVLSFFREKTRRPISFKDIVSLMKLSHKEAKVLRRILGVMVRDGNLVLTRKGLYGPAEDMNLANGYFESHKDGYGFVVLEKPGERDMFIPAWATLGAMNNDRVLVRVENWHKREGRIIRILERAHTRIAGKFEVSKTAFYVRPKNKSVHFDLYIAQKDRGGAKNKDMVIAEITSYPTDRKEPAGKGVKNIGKPEDPKTEVEAVIDEFNLPRRFPRNVLDKASFLYQFRAEDTERRIHNRKDLRSLRTVTIDGERAKDFDDAVSINISKHGYTLYVHIADVGFYVNWNSAIDIEARKRGTSIYFPDRVIPMLPKDLSEDLCSLKPKVERLTFTVEMEFNSHGQRLSSMIYPSVIVSNERMTYTSLKKILIDKDKGEREKYSYLLHNFETMGELCNTLKAQRLKRGSLDFDLPEPEVLLDIQGNPEAIIKAERNFAHMIIEEFMIAENEAVAEYFESLGVPTLYRIHEEPEPTRVEEVIRIINSLETLKGRNTIKTIDLLDLIRHIHGLPEEEIINLMVLRSLKQARYSAVNIGHFGLASKCYTHFTSPIRRYPDLIIHRILREILAKKRLSDKRIHELEHMLPDIAFHSSRMERQSDDAERAVLAAMRVWFMKDKTGEEFEGKVVSVTPFGLKIRLKDYYVEGFLHVSYMTDDFYKYDDKSMSLYGIHKKKRFSIGNELMVRIDRVDIEEREIILGIQTLLKTT